MAMSYVGWGAHKRVVLPLLMTPMTRAELIEATGWTYRQINTAISSLLQDGLIKRIPPLKTYRTGVFGPLPGKYVYAEYAGNSCCDEETSFVES